MRASSRSAVGTALADALGDPHPDAFTGDRIMVGWEETPVVLDALNSIGARIHQSAWETLTVVGPDGIQVAVTTAALTGQGARLLARAFLEVDVRLTGNLASLLTEANLGVTLPELGVDLGDVPWTVVGTPVEQRTLAWALIAIAENYAADLPFGSTVPLDPQAEVLAVLLSDAGASVDVYSEAPYDFDDLWLLVLVLARDPDLVTRARLLSPAPVRLAALPGETDSRSRLHTR